jgi:hypothetical protein
MKYLPKAGILKTWLSKQQCSEVGPLGNDWIMRALISSMNDFINGLVYLWIHKLMDYWGVVETLGGGAYFERVGD